MKNFATQEYYDTIIEAAKKMGYRLLAQVQITTDDHPFYIPVDYARDTCLAFDIPGKAMFTHFHHTEHRGMFGGDYKNHWNMTVEYDYGDYSTLLGKHVELNSGYNEDVFIQLEKSIRKFDLANLQSGWSSSSDYFQLTFSGDVVEHDHADLCPHELVLSVLRQLKERHPEYLKEMFNQLCVSWPPFYIFTGEQQHGIRCHEEQKKLSNTYWERFGEGRKHLSEKIGHMYGY